MCGISECIDFITDYTVHGTLLMKLPSRRVSTQEIVVSEVDMSRLCGLMATAVCC